MKTVDCENFIFIILPKWIPPFHPSKGDCSYNDPSSAAPARAPYIPHPRP